MCLVCFLIGRTTVCTWYRKEKGILCRRGKVAERMAKQTCSLHDHRVPGARKWWVMEQS